MTATVEDFQTFLAVLENEGELKRIAAEVDPDLEIAAITERVCLDQDNNKVLLFEKPKGSVFKVATNAFGSEKRICQALGFSSFAELTERMEQLLGDFRQLSFEELENLLSGLAAEFGQSIAPFSLNNRIDSLEKLPFLRSWDEDGSVAGKGRYATLGVTSTHSLDGIRNFGLYRGQILGGSSVALRFHKGSGAAQHLDSYRAAGKKMPLAISFGGDPAIAIAAMMPLPGKVDEAGFAAMLKNRLVKLEETPEFRMVVPASAEVVIEGTIDPYTTVIEGPFGNHTGFYAEAEHGALMQVTAVYVRDNAVLPATVVGPPPVEDSFMAAAWHTVMKVLLKRLIPAIKDIYIPPELAFHQYAFIHIESSPRAVINDIAEQLWSCNWFSKAGIIVFTDYPPVAADGRANFWKIINSIDLRDDLVFCAIGGRIAVDATMPHGKMELRRSSELTRLIDYRWKEYGFV